MDIDLELGNNSSSNFEVLEESMNTYLDDKQRFWTKPCNDAIEKKLNIDWYLHKPTTQKHLEKHLNLNTKEPSFKPLYDKLTPKIKSCFISHQNWQTSISAVESFEYLNFPSNGAVTNFDILFHLEAENSIRIDSIDIESDILRFSLPNQRLDIADLTFNSRDGRLALGKQYWDFPANSIERDMIEVVMSNVSYSFHWDEIANAIDSQFQAIPKDEQRKYRKKMSDAMLRIQKKIGAYKIFHWDKGSIRTKIEDY